MHPAASSAQVSLGCHCPPPSPITSSLPTLLAHVSPPNCPDHGQLTSDTTGQGRQCPAASAAIPAVQRGCSLDLTALSPRRTADGPEPSSPRVNPQSQRPVYYRHSHGNAGIIPLQNKPLLDLALLPSPSSPQTCSHLPAAPEVPERLPSSFLSPAEPSSATRSSQGSSHPFSVLPASKASA